MNINKYTEKGREAVAAALQIAEQMNHAQIEPEHLLLALVEQQDGIVPALLRKMGVEPKPAGRSAARPNCPSSRPPTAGRSRPSPLASAR